MVSLLTRNARRHTTGLALALVALASPSHGQAQAQGPSEAALKARLTLSLTRFAQWPAGVVADTLRLCVAQRDAGILLAFSEADGQVVNGRRIQVVKAPPLAGCHVLYVHASADRASELMRAASAGPTLIVADVEGSLARGAMVEFVPVNDSIRFDIHMGAIRRAQLSMPSQVLKLARQVME